ncbi:type I-F CRISPR-associated helicase Cas3f [Spirochaeta africana]|uniref:CRISPR-associated helicase Cas3, subtype I-F/YPEST n=1 Tax=Spirochaeta africana (strain ATCC 700263 / DSM 8902 / Z-7692) TaxID=889378 RepID=H9UG66_SPIAZ|nr:type I-F CRISPR-associated helicase Cas3f [Spirochaeta africana]AFG36509.1 CRISPR-associated helicase Cas3, subtype I-F/YPEST [Spirochaeta africana DSM 8902]
MIVTFISQCEKKALSRTRRVLDTYASRIGSRTWQTVITMDGLAAIKKHLRKTATKNTAVACHWMRGKTRTELLWVVGNRQQFDSEGVVPVHSTQRDVFSGLTESDWDLLPQIKIVAAISALFHDWGKASELFQSKLRPSDKRKEKVLGDPVRHEWVSCFLFAEFVRSCGSTDREWLDALSDGRLDEKKIIQSVQASEKTLIEKVRHVPADLPPLASVVLYILLTHHRLPVYRGSGRSQWKGVKRGSFKELLQIISYEWSYANYLETEDQRCRLPLCFSFPHGICTDSPAWMKQIKKWSQRALERYTSFSEIINSPGFRSLIHFSRLAVMLGDHIYSSQQADPSWKTDIPLYANTEKDNSLKQKLDEHLVGVMKQALKTAHLLPRLESSMDEARDVQSLKAAARPGTKYYWQDKAVEKILAWRTEQAELLKKQDQSFGFFTVNMASTGCGKTTANAKVMQALSRDCDSLRYILALGLRTLTLQTGDEYKERLGLDETELAVLIGSKAIATLHREWHNAQQNEDSEDTVEMSSESQETLLDDHIDFACDIPEGDLRTLLQTEKDRQMLFAPVLSCTIDHMMAATETTRGGRWILPFMRLMTSDLVIDEIDDFSGTDMIAVGRLVFLAGMLGRKVMISSATITPDIAEGYFHTYHQGWTTYTASRNANETVGCCWIDEFRTVTSTVQDSDSISASRNFANHHNHFIEKRVRSLRSQRNQKGARRVGQLIQCKDLLEIGSEVEREEALFERSAQTILSLHQDNCHTDPVTGKTVSFGCVRMANIDPCVSMTKYLLGFQWPEDVCVYAMAYHSRQVLLLRNEQERHLDSVLKCKTEEPRRAAFSNLVIRKQIEKNAAANIVFVLVATPVEEVGRDHDFDWAIIEPSSYRSIIQLAGRVRRHRSTVVQKPNIAILEFNRKGLLSEGDQPVFTRPGFETDSMLLNSHSMASLVNVRDMEKGIDAVPRISRNQELKPKDSLVDLEHNSIHCSLTHYKQVPGPETMHGWHHNSFWWLTGQAQQYNYAPFRAGESQIEICDIYTEDGNYFGEWEQRNKIWLDRELVYRIDRERDSDMGYERLWLHRDYRALLERREDQYGESPGKASGVFGRLTFPKRFEGSKLLYSEQFGLVENRRE